MNVIQTGPLAIEQTVHLKKYPATLRLWHWLNAIVITALLLTVWLSSTLLNTRSNAQFIQGQLKDAGAIVSFDQAREAAHGIRDKVWDLHTWIGYGLAALLVFRLMLELFQVADQRLLRKIKAAYRQYVVLKQNRELSRHEFWVKSLYAMFYVMLIIQCITGICLAFEDDVSALKAIHAIRETHSFNMYLILAFILVHFAGVYLAERKKSPGIVSDMINGGQG